MMVQAFARAAIGVTNVKHLHEIMYTILDIRSIAAHTRIGMWANALLLAEFLLALS